MIDHTQAVQAPSSELAKTVDLPWDLLAKNCQSQNAWVKIVSALANLSEMQGLGVVSDMRGRVVFPTCNTQLRPMTKLASSLQKE